LVVELRDQDVKGMVATLRTAVEKHFEGYYIIALLSGPPVDVVKPLVVWEGRWYERACYLEIGYPTDDLCTEILNDIYQEDYPRSALRNVNGYLRLWYSVPIAGEDTAGVHGRAREYMRQAIDLVRLLTSADVGILHFHGKVTTHDIGMISPFMSVFQDDREVLPRTPTRRVYDACSVADAFGKDAVGRLENLLTPTQSRR
jgi:hypothetical protein